MDLHKRARDLAALALNQKGKPEGDTALRLLRRHCATHGLDEAAIRRSLLAPMPNPSLRPSSPPTPPAPPFTVTKKGKMGILHCLVKRDRWCKILLSLVASYHGCLMDYNTATNEACIYGHNGEIEKAYLQFATLRDEILLAIDGMKAALTEQGIPAPERRRRLTKTMDHTIAGVSMRLEKGGKTVTSEVRTFFDKTSDATTEYFHIK